MTRVSDADAADTVLPPKVDQWLAAAGFPTTEFQVHRLMGGANNRVFQLTAGDSSVLLKLYFRHAGDSRDRLKTEFSFCEFAWRHGLRSAPQPLACAPEASAALYEYIPGRPVLPAEVDAGLVADALAFYDAINARRDAADAQVLPKASEACFSIPDHITCVDARVQRLTTIQGPTDVDRLASVFVRDELVRAWEEIRYGTLACASEERLLLTVNAEDERLSPCDFGFHNAIRTTDDALRFIDFEYAGWDDPARTVCDFFCQPAVPAPAAQFDAVATRLTSGLSDPEQHVRRIGLLFPVYQVKWCCILLNDFLNVGNDRRQFSTGARDADDRKTAQLRKAGALLTEVLSKGSGAHRSQTKKWRT